MQDVFLHLFSSPKLPFALPPVNPVHDSLRACSTPRQNRLGNSYHNLSDPLKLVPLTWNTLKIMEMETHLNTSNSQNQLHTWSPTAPAEIPRDPLGAAMGPPAPPHGAPASPHEFFGAFDGHAQLLRRRAAGVHQLLSIDGARCLVKWWWIRLVNG